MCDTLMREVYNNSIILPAIQPPWDTWHSFSFQIYVGVFLYIDIDNLQSKKLSKIFYNFFEQVCLKDLYVLYHACTTFIVLQQFLQMSLIDLSQMVLHNSSLHMSEKDQIDHNKAHTFLVHTWTVHAWQFSSVHNKSLNPKPTTIQRVYYPAMQSQKMFGRSAIVAESGETLN